jgi:hypothetical protein
MQTCSLTSPTHGLSAASVKVYRIFSFCRRLRLSSGCKTGFFLFLVNICPQKSNTEIG